MSELQTKTIKSTFSLFGNFSKLNNRESDIRRVFDGYQIVVQQENLPNGVPAKVYRGINSNVAFTIRAYRIDIEFGFINDTITVADFIENCKTVADTMTSIDTIRGNRIAYNSVDFVVNDGDLVPLCNKIFNVEEVFGGQAKEINLRVNHIKVINGEEMNSVFIIQDGAVTHNQTKEKLNALFLNKDINTVAQNTTVRFDLKDVDKYLSDFVLEAEDRNKTFLSKLK